MAVLFHKWEFKNIEVEFMKVSEKFDHQDFQILELGSLGTSWFWQLVQALGKCIGHDCNLMVAQFTAEASWYTLCLLYRIVYGLVAVPLPDFFPVDYQYLQILSFNDLSPTADHQKLLQVLIFPPSVVQWNHYENIPI